MGKNNKKWEKSNKTQIYILNVYSNIKKKNDKSTLFKNKKWVIGIIISIFCVLLAFFLPILSKKFPPVSPSLDTIKNGISTPEFYHAKVSKDTNIDYLAFQTGQNGYISINLTNNDESTLVVNDIYLDVFDYQPITNITLLDTCWGGAYSNPVYYGVQLGNLCKEYKCTLLDANCAKNFASNHEIPYNEIYKFMGEQIEYNKTDEIEIIFYTQYPGIYHFKILIDYSIRGFNNRIESDEYNFISLDPSSIHQP